jgi:hypothetical protein
MAAMTDKLENALIDWLLRAQAIGLTGATAAAGTGLANTYWALIRATAGVSPRSTAVTVGQTTVPATPNGRMYRCSVAGTTGAGEPTWATTTAGSTTDGTATWIEMTTDFETNSATMIAAECTGLGGYARATVASGMTVTGWAGTQSSASTTASTGTGGTTSNNGVMSYAPSASWGAVGAVVAYDAITTGNALIYSVLTLPKTINSGDTVTFPAASLTFQIDN